MVKLEVLILDDEGVDNKTKPSSQTLAASIALFSFLSVRYRVDSTLARLSDYTR